MNLHKHKEEFYDLCLLTSDYFNISYTNIKRDYYLVMMLFNLFNSQYKDLCVFKGGTSLSKCYKDSINRFSEDIDLTLIPNKEYNDKKYDKTLKEIEVTINQGFEFEKINNERNKRNKSSWVWFKGEDKDQTKIKLEIGSSIIPYPYSKRNIKSYIQEYLELNNYNNDIKKYGLRKFELNVLDVTRTFLDKVMAVKRHAICGTLKNKTRHIYDVVELYNLKEIKTLLKDKKILKDILSKTKKTDSFYLTKRNINENYNPLGKYDFDSWKHLFNEEIEKNYLNLKELISNKQVKLDFEKAINIFKELNSVFKNIRE